MPGIVLNGWCGIILFNTTLSLRDTIFILWMKGQTEREVICFMLSSKWQNLCDSWVQALNLCITLPLWGPEPESIFLSIVPLCHGVSKCLAQFLAHREAEDMMCFSLKYFHVDPHLILTTTLRRRYYSLSIDEPFVIQKGEFMQGCIAFSGGISYPLFP